MSPNESQIQLRLLAAPKPMTVELLYRMFSTALIPVEEVRTRLFRNMNADRFSRVLSTPRLPIPVTTLDNSNKALRFIEIHHLAAFIEAKASQADESMAQILAKGDALEPTDDE